MQPTPHQPTFPFKTVLLVLLTTAVVIYLLIARTVVKPAQQATSNVTRPLVDTSVNKSQTITPYDTAQTLFDLTKYPLYHFKNDDIYAVMDQVREWYHISYTYQGTISNKFTGTVPIGIPIDQSLRLLAKMGHVYFKLSPPDFVVIAIDTANLYN